MFCFPGGCYPSGKFDLAKSSPSWNQKILESSNDIAKDQARLAKVRPQVCSRFFALEG